MSPNRDTEPDQQLLANPFEEGDSRRELWAPFWVEVWESLGPRIQHRARLNEEAADALHNFLKAPPDERPHRWEASAVPWLRTVKPDVKWPDTAPTDEEVALLLVKAIADDPMKAVPARVDKLADEALEKFVKNDRDLEVYGQILPHIGALVLTAFRQEWAVILARMVARGMFSPEEAADQRESDIQKMADLIRDWQQGWAAIALAQVTPQAARATAEAGNYKEYKRIRNTDQQASNRPRYNIAPTQPVITVRKEHGKKTRHFTTIRWGLIPSWAKDVSIATRTLTMQSPHHCLEQVVAAVVAASLMFSMFPPASRASTEKSHAPSVPLRLPLPKQGNSLPVNSASLAISAVVGNSLGARGVGTHHSEKKSVVPVVAGNSTKLHTRNVESRSIVKPSHLDAAGITGTRPLAFIENTGQFDEQVKFQVAGNESTLWLTNNGIVFDFLRAKSNQSRATLPESQPRTPNLDIPGRAKNPRMESPVVTNMERDVIYQDFIGTSRGMALETKGVQPGTYNYLSGSEPSKWQTEVRRFSEIVYHDLWEGVDLRLFGNGPDLEQEFIVKPGSDLNQVRVAYQGIIGLEVAKDGSLLIRTAAGQMRESAPRIYQIIGRRRVRVKGQFKIVNQTSYTFQIAKHDPLRALIIDPTLLYSTYLGGSAGNNTGSFSFPNQEVATGIAVDATGSAYVTGYTLSTDFPTTPGAFQTAAASGWNAFVTKLNTTGSGLVYSTILNGTSGNAFSTSIAVDQNGDAYVAGYGVSSGFPTTPNAYWPTNPQQSCTSGFGDFFMTELNSAGNQLLYSTCFGVSGDVAYGSVYGYYPKAIAVDSHGRAYIAGGAAPSAAGNNTGAQGIPITPNAYESQYPNMPASAFLTVLDTTASGVASLFYSTYLSIAPAYNFQSQGVLPSTIANAVAVDSFGKAYVVGATTPGFPVTPGAYDTTPAGCNGTVNCTNAFVAKIDPTASGPQSLIYSTYLGGFGSNNIANAIAVDSSGAYITGSTAGSYYNSFPITPGAFQTTAGQNFSGAGFVTKFNAAGSSLVYSTYLAGNIYAPSSGNGIAVDSLGNAYIAGQFRAQGSSTFPVTPDAFQNAFTKLNGDFSEAFLTKLNPTGSGLVYSSYLGGDGDDVATAVAIDQNGDAYVTGHTSSANFPITPGAFQPVRNGTGDAFITKFPLGTISGVTITGIVPGVGGNSGSVTAYITGTGLQANATLELVCAGQATVLASNVNVSADGRTITGTFDLTGTNPGACNVEVMNPDGTSASSSQPFTVEAGGAADMWVDIVGMKNIRGGSPQSFYVVYGNRGTIDAKGIVVSIETPSVLAWALLNGQTPVFKSQHDSSTLRAFAVPVIPPEGSAAIVISLTGPNVPHGGAAVPFQFRAWIAAGQR
jgi:SOS response associated peptidase (SRAP)/Beta-propeller repeat